MSQKPTAAVIREGKYYFWLRRANVQEILRELDQRGIQVHQIDATQNVRCINDVVHEFKWAEVPEGFTRPHVLEKKMIEVAGPNVMVPVDFTSSQSRVVLNLLRMVKNAETEKALAE